MLEIIEHYSWTVTCSLGTSLHVNGISARGYEFHKYPKRKENQCTIQNMILQTEFLVVKKKQFKLAKILRAHKYLEWR